ncbi:uncharacterized protein LY79DRAFT_674140 [Colletotrichum navitas]|uniref:Uncharacterized protein n=1 Tax=Colletotrichum navitas TaxID=681940 RepID=A0AAD8PM46_9PEZI|nr:uncharacterized protein LY79DRAFT_674140 [Colletotrichum navitas]KAK1570260.1 hypothetical protein LY79DRAFT_674140 [Colletotrichum navitas]
MCITDVVHYMRGICNARLGKPRRRTLERCPAALAAAFPHCGLLYDPVPEPARSDPALDPSGLEFEVLKTAPGYTPIEPQHRRPKPKMVRCELCVEHLGEEEVKAREKWWRAENRASAGTRREKRAAPGPSTAGWCDVLR